ncbi:DUF4082 domain-containing protein [Intrasporangium sp.]|uniref:DUF4082 domain-containing protein n=1 Tax=Intrasporangium sp. TaxID=1925024 RepID=UPI003221BC67
MNDPTPQEQRGDRREGRTRAFALPLKPGSRRRIVVAGLAAVAVAGTVVATLSGGLTASAAANTYSIWPSTTVPGTVADNDTASVEVGTRFTTNTPGWVTAVRYYKGAENTGTKVGKLWDSSGRLLAQTTFSGETRSGWQQAALSAPVELKTGVNYVVSYRAPQGRYADDQYALSPSKSRVNHALTATQGVYTYAGWGMPRETWRDSNYFVDVVFTTVRPGNPAPPATTAPQPSTTTPRPTASTTTAPRPSTTSASRPTTSTTTTSTTTTSTTTAPRPTATETSKAGCVGDPNTPGGPDPWGGCWPGPQNTGYPKGLPGDTRKPVTLTTYTGPTTIRSCGIVIDSKIVNQDLLVEAGNGTDLNKPCVTIRNSLIKGVVFAEKTSYGPFLIEDTEVVPNSLSWWENVGRSNFRAIRVNSHGSEGVVKCDSNCEVKDTWVHGMTLAKAYHYNAVGGNGTNGYLIEHNFLSCGDWSSVMPGDLADGGCSAVIGFYGDFAPNQNITINRNFLISTFDMSENGKHRQAAYCLNPGYYPTKAYPDTRNISVTNNVFGRGGSGKCGVYGPTNSLNAIGRPNGNVWSNNHFDDGTVINRVEE